MLGVVVDLPNLLLTLFLEVLVAVVMGKNVTAQPPETAQLIPGVVAVEVQTVMAAPVVAVL
jgi:hypothetical protein